MEQKIFEKIVLVNLDTSVWSGACVMRANDFSLGVDGKLPPKEVTSSLGSKFLVDPKSIKELKTARKRMVYHLERNGVHFMGGYALPADKADAILAKLDSLKQDFESEKAKFLAAYPSLVDEWAAKWPEFSERILAAKKSAEQIDAAISARADVFSIGPRTQEEADKFASSCERSLSDSLRHSISQDCKALVSMSFNGKTEASQRTVNALRHLRDRIASLSFLADTVHPILTVLDQIISLMPTQGKFSGAPFLTMVSMAQAMADEEFLGKLISGDVSPDLWVTQIHARQEADERDAAERALFEMQDDEEEAIEADPESVRVIANVEQKPSIPCIPANAEAFVEDEEEAFLF